MSEKLICENCNKNFTRYKNEEPVKDDDKVFPDEEEFVLCKKCYVEIMVDIFGDIPK